MTELEKELLRAVEALAKEQQSAQQRMNQQATEIKQLQEFTLHQHKLIESLDQSMTRQAEQLERFAQQVGRLRG